jgi:glycosyltransferase involved in cell wall biosynthesis
VKILLPTDPFLPVPPVHYGGVERIVASLLVALQRRGHEVGLVAHPDSRAPADYFIAWPSTTPNSAPSHARNTLTLLRAVVEFRPSLIHSFARLAYLAPLLLFNVPKIMTYGRPTGGRRHRIAASLGGRSLAFTGCSAFIAEMGAGHGGVWHAIPNFVDTDFYSFSPNVPADAPLVFLSRIEPIKGTHIAIDVAKRTGRRLLVAGNHANSGIEGEYWETRIKPEFGKNGIEYVGTVDDEAKVKLLGSAAALIVPIQWDEPFGIVFVEALACGTPVIACPRGALPEIVREGIDGFLIRDVDEACRAVREIASIDRHQCRLRAEQNFSSAAVVPRYEALYDSMLRNSSNSNRLANG